LSQSERCLDPQAVLQAARFTATWLLRPSLVTPSWSRYRRLRPALAPP